MCNNFAMLMFCFVAILFCLNTLHGATHKPDEKWRLCTEDTCIWFDQESGSPEVFSLQHAQLQAGPELWDWVSRPPVAALPESAEIDGQVSKLNWRYKGAKSEGGKISFTYESDNPKLELCSVWEAVSLPGPVENSVIITNQGTSRVKILPPPTISFPIRVRPGSNLELWWVEKGAGRPSDVGTHIEEITPGYARTLTSGPTGHGEVRDAIPWFCINDATAKQGFYGGIEFSGWIQIDIRRNSDSSITVSLGLDPREGQTRTALEPGASVDLPTCFIGIYNGEVDDGCNRLHRWVESHLRPEMPGGVTPLLTYNTWGNGVDINEELAMKMIDDCEALGFEMFHIDAGWFRNVGDWRPHETKFPNGMARISDYARSKGIKFGLWAAWTHGGSPVDPAQNTLSPHNPEQKDWFGKDYPEDWRNRAFTGVPVCLGSPEAREWALARLSALVKDYKLDMLEHDQVNVVLDKCDRENHDHIAGDIVDTSRAAAEGYYAVYDALRKENPHLIFENCVDGGRMIDFGVVKRTHYYSITDSYDPLSNRRAFYDASFPLPPSMLECYVESHPGQTPANFKYMLRSGMMGWCTLMTDTTNWTTEQKAIAKREFDLYRTKLRPFIASGDIYHVLPRPDGKNWDGIQYINHENGKGVLYVFRPKSEQETKLVLLRGLNPSKRYSVKAEDGSIEAATLSGQQLMESGITVSLPEQDSSDLIFFQEAG